MFKQLQLRRSGKPVGLESTFSTLQGFSLICFRQHPVKGRCFVSMMAETKPGEQDSGPVRTHPRVRGQRGAEGILDAIKISRPSGFSDLKASFGLSRGCRVLGENAPDSPKRHLHVGSCQNLGPFLGTLNNRCRIIIGTQEGTVILTTTHVVGCFCLAFAV